ncbi:beta-glucosidase [Fragilariopsis cylindrus CCMP1102]|uniref:Beta-glucosidase n=1 Tax=Fragilariopsis cylindrus CCMP1102 TaxID=635003 RepID=A0A1E7FJ30_9STRA|nr:beta-glucosidase [Fragilariopsis cylindrus CCMP1102]|eukprot:OEU18176.1 beta-glucosidase [Fragilariopsis cylindrus CCMP1102]
MVCRRRCNRIHSSYSNSSSNIAIFFVVVVIVITLLRLTPSAVVVVVSAFGIDSTNIMIAPPPPKRRDLPEKIIVGYATQCTEKVEQAVRDGVNVVIWSFVEIIVDGNKDKDNDTVTEKEHSTVNKKAANAYAKCISHFNRDCAKQMINKLDSEGYDDTVHLVSFGGWNGPHLPDELDVYDMYKSFQDFNTYCDNIFHGIDWDLEGHDRLDHSTNLFSIDCLNNMGIFSQLASNDGYIVGMAPPQSYLDIHAQQQQQQQNTNENGNDSSKMLNFSRYVNLTDTSKDRDGWHTNFHYFGCNVYSYLVSKYGQYIDFISIQFYESYSRAGLNIYHKQINPSEYLISYIKDLNLKVLPSKNDNNNNNNNNNDMKEEAEVSFFVDFDQDPLLNYSSRQVTFPLSKLVFGFANGWGVSDDDKVVYFDPLQINVAYKSLLSDSMDMDINLTPRGFMFWVIDEEGTNDVNFARSLNEILKIRSTKKQQQQQHEQCDDGGDISNGEVKKVS